MKAGMLTYIGKPAQAVALLQLALRLDPDAGSLYFLLLCRADYFLGDAKLARLSAHRVGPETEAARRDGGDGGDGAVGGRRLTRNAPTQMLTTSMAA